jgi:hypothetical protein
MGDRMILYSSQMATRSVTYHTRQVGFHLSADEVGYTAAPSRLPYMVAIITCRITRRDTGHRMIPRR